MVISNSIPSPAAIYLQRSLPEQRQILKDQYTACRQYTLEFASSLSDREYYRQSHPDFSPIGWHLGHIAFTESLWILEHLAHQSGPDTAYRRLFAADGLPKAERQNLPALEAVLTDLAKVRQRVLTYLDTAPLEHQHRLWWWLLQHESQHLETMRMVRAMHGKAGSREQGEREGRRDVGTRGRRDAGNGATQITPYSTLREATTASTPLTPHPSPEIYFPATTFSLGYGGIDAMDNECPVHAVSLEGFWIDALPVTQGDFQRFMAAGGYSDRGYWSAAGWQWLQGHPVEEPLYWHQGVEAWECYPVCGVSYYEAEAYARFEGKRLPTEAEWERAACRAIATANKPLYPWGHDWPTSDRGNFGHAVGGTTPVGQYGASPAHGGDWLGNVWEWTSSWFSSYEGFTAFPYRGYSAAYFDGQHRVLRGGSWATLPWALRNPLRNWYFPQVRQVFAGFRCAHGEE